VASPNFSLGEVLLQQAAISAGFYYGDVDLVERLDPHSQVLFSKRDRWMVMTSLSNYLVESGNSGWAAIPSDGLLNLTEVV
jgi:hypothetical protein